MSHLLKIISAMIIISFLISTGSFVLFSETEETPVETDNNQPPQPSNTTPEDNTSDQNNSDNGNNETNNNQEELVHYVFVEEATATTCRYCPPVAKITLVITVFIM